MMEVQGLFLDYDGTISPINAPREEARVSEEMQAILSQIKQLIPVGIITTKGMGFIVPRTPFASAWCAIAGLEMKIGERLIIDPRIQEAMPRVELALEYAIESSDNLLFVEEKKVSTGQSVAFCLDWRHSRDLKEAEARAVKVLDYCQNLLLEVVTYEGQPFFDVYPCPVDKGKALAELKRNFNLESGVMYLGDSKVDNPAFKTADISIGVRHEESAGDLDCDYYVQFGEVVGLLRGIMGNNLVFDRRSPEITVRRRA